MVQRGPTDSTRITSTLLLTPNLTGKVNQNNFKTIYIKLKTKLDSFVSSYRFVNLFPIFGPALLYRSGNWSEAMLYNIKSIFKKYMTHNVVGTKRKLRRM
jgi:hypothetical protein